MTDVETLAERVQTVERAVTDGADEFPEASTLADVESRIEALESRVADIDDRTTELEAATQALRGYVGNVRSVNEDVEQRADAALAATDRLERRLDEELSAPEASVAESTGESTGQDRSDPFDRSRGLNGATQPTDERPGHTPASGLEGDGFEDGPTGDEPGRGGGDVTSPATVAPDRQSAESSEPGVLERIRAHL